MWWWNTLGSSGGNNIDDIGGNRWGNILGIRDRLILGSLLGINDGNKLRTIDTICNDEIYQGHLMVSSLII